MGNIGIAALAGFIVPLLVSFLKSTSWSPRAKQGVAVVTSIIVAVGITVIDNGADLTDWQGLITNLTVVFSVAQVFYQQYFGGTALNSKLEHIGVGGGNA